MARALPGAFRRCQPGRRNIHTSVQSYHQPLYRQEEPLAGGGLSFIIAFLRVYLTPLIHTLLKIPGISGFPPHGKDVGGAEQVARHRGRRRNDVRVRHRGSPAERLHRPAGEGYPPHGRGGVVLGGGGQGGGDLGRHVYAGRSRQQVRACACMRACVDGCD